ncbi:MAG: Cytochrome c-type biogenesis protein CcmI [Burkholderia sp.]|jgi:cytochrome c-type biogenesis protein CcmH
MQTIFILICAAMAIIAVACVAVPLWTGGRRRGSDEDTRRAENLAILRQHAKDLEQAKAGGKIDADTYADARAELERRVLEETSEGGSGKAAPKSSGAARRLAVVLAVLIPCAAAFGYAALGRFTAMDPVFLKMMNDETRMAGGHTMADMQRAIDDLRARVKEHPDDVNGWYLLARTCASLERYPEALAAYRELDKLVPNNADVLADMADMMAAVNNKTIDAEVEKVLKRALSIDPKQWKALALLAIYEWDRQNYAAAANYWERLVAAVPPDFPDIDQIKLNIAEARRLAGLPPAQGESAAAGKSSAGVEVPPTQAPAAESFVAGRVTLSEALADKVKPDDAVFIYARPVTGSRMPVAFIRITAAELPYDFRLTSDMRMATGGANLAELDEVIIGARVSHSGNFMPQPGDCEGETGPVKVGDGNVKLEISRHR